MLLSITKVTLQVEEISNLGNGGGEHPGPVSTIGDMILEAERKP